MKPKTILLCVDASQESKKALEAALGFAAQGASLMAVNVVNRHVVNQMSRNGSKSQAEVEVELEENGWCYLYDAEETAKAAGARIAIIQENGYPEEIIPRCAEMFGADLIIIGQARGRKNDMGQTGLAQQLIENAACAVLVVK